MRRISVEYTTKCISGLKFVEKTERQVQVKLGFLNQMRYIIDINRAL